jgi:2,4-dienoyl-CoA reductase-like NADH-dependent reductase (Old Yellow Enzyme family)
VPRFYGGDALAGWAHVLEAVHAAGGRIMPQLWHVGSRRRRETLSNPGVPPIAPSGLDQPGVAVAEPMSEREIARVIDAYAEGASTARRLGFDGLELHGAHGYLIDQFFWDKTNRRIDRYGGDLAGRTRFAADIVRACRRAAGRDFPIVFRFSQWKLQDFAARLVDTPGDLARFLQPLVDAGVDVFHCSTRRFWHPEFEGSHLNLAGWTKKLTGRPVITVGSVGLDGDFVAALIERRSMKATGVDHLVRMVADGEVDLVAVGRALLVDPAWAAKIRDGRFDELRPYTPDALKTLS